MSDEPKARSSKAFDLSKSILTVVLASVAAAWISHHYKVEEENAAVYAESRKAATNTYYDIIDTIAVRAAVGFQWHDDEMAHWQQYENMRAYWNEHRYSILALTKRYFGVGTEQQFRDFIPKFDYVDDKLVAAKNAFRDKKPMPEDFTKADGLLNYLYNLDNEIRNFSESLQEQLKHGQVDIYSPQPPLKKP
jgi:hypothetical protein